MYIIPAQTRMNLELPDRVVHRELTEIELMTKKTTLLGRQLMLFFILFIKVFPLFLHFNFLFCLISEPKGSTSWSWQLPWAWWREIPARNMTWTCGATRSCPITTVIHSSSKGELCRLTHSYHLLYMGIQDCLNATRVGHTYKHNRSQDLSQEEVSLLFLSKSSSPFPFKHHPSNLTRRIILLPPPKP